MKHWKAAASLVVAIACVAGCDNKDDNGAGRIVYAGSAASMMDKTMSGMKDAATAAKEKAAVVGDKAADMKDSAVSNATDAKNSALSSATDAKDSLTTQAQKYYDQAKDYINSKNFSGAGDMVTKLQGLKSQLPAEWSTKVDELKSMLDSAKAKVSNMVPTTMPSTN